MTSWRISARAVLGTLGIDVELEGGDAPLALVGPNGSGKTSLLRIIVGAHRPTQAEIEVGGKHLFSTSRSIDLPIEQRRVGYVPQGYGLFPHLRVIDNVAFGLSTGPRKHPRSERRRAALTTLDALDCAHLGDRLPARLSGGEQQRVALARALVIRPAMLLLDEPLAALDAGGRRAVRTFLAERLRALGRPSIVVTHDARDVAAFGGRVAVLDHGRIVQHGSLSDLRAAPASEFVAEFIGNSPPTRAAVIAHAEVAP